MKLVTTSRKPAPELRTLGKDLAFALGGKYSPRGKAGVDEVLSWGDPVLVVSRRGRKTLIETYVSGESISGIFLSGFSVSRRDVPLEKGLRTGSEKVYHELAECLDITRTDAGAKEILFHGAQAKGYVLRIAERPPGTQSSVSHQDE
ncbi:Brix domain-containing protein [Methanogenium cariaci]|jgi:U3 small nucleolar ribonucleoprotein protein IMP4